MQNDQPNRYNIQALSISERETLLTRIIPTAERWLREYNNPSSMYSNAYATLRNWKMLSGHEAEPK